MEGPLSQYLEAGAEQIELATREKRFYPPLTISKLEFWLGVYCLGPAEQDCSLRTKCCYHLLVL